MKHTVRELAEITGATFWGNGTLEIGGVAPIGSEGPRKAVPLLKKRYLEQLDARMDVTVIVSNEFEAELRELGFHSLLVYDNPLMGLKRIIDIFLPKEHTEPSVHQDASVSEEAELASDISVGANAVVEKGAIVGEGTQIGPGAIVKGCARIGRFVRIGPNAVIGYDGFGFFSEGKQIVRMEQRGGVMIGDCVDIGAGTCIDRGTIGDTVIGKGCCLDNMVQVGHNSKVGENVVVAAQTGLAGSTEIEDGVMIGGQVGIADHLRVEKGARIGAKSGVTRDIGAGEEVSGYPAMGRWQWLRVIAKLKR